MAFLEKLNKMAKNIEDKTGDALEISKHTAQKAKEEAAHREDLIGSGPKCLIRAVPPRQNNRPLPPKPVAKTGKRPAPKKPAAPKSRGKKR